MTGLIKLTHAANNMQARQDFARLREIADQHGIAHLVEPVADDASWRKLDKAADVTIKRILAERPELQEQIGVIYPGFALE